MSLRLEFLACYVARHTIVAIVRSVIEHALESKSIVDAADVVSGTIVTTIDGHMNHLRFYLNFGSDRPRGSSPKWFGRFEPERLHRWKEAAQFANALFPVTNNDPDFHLDAYAELIASLKPLTLEADPAWKTAQSAWTILETWARGPGRACWKVDGLESLTLDEL